MFVSTYSVRSVIIYVLFNIIFDILNHELVFYRFIKLKIVLICVLFIFASA